MPSGKRSPQNRKRPSALRDGRSCLLGTPRFAHIRNARSAEVKFGHALNVNAIIDGAIMAMPAIMTTIDETRTAVAAARAKGFSIGLVPTMGALHAGHASLLQAARRETDFVVASIFVNPTQFGPNEDLARYPRPFAKDVEVCGAEGVDLIFHPEAGALYPPDFRTY